MNKRNKYSAEFKTKAVLEILSEAFTVNNKYSKSHQNKEYKGS
jgi:transposase-like protein